MNGRGELKAVMIVAAVIVVVIVVWAFSSTGQFEKEVQVNGTNSSNSNVSATIFANSSEVRGSVTLPAHGSQNITLRLHLQDRISVSVSKGSVNFEGSNVVRNTTNSISIMVQSNGFVFVWLNDGLGFG